MSTLAVCSVCCSHTLLTPSAPYALAVLQGRYVFKLLAVDVPAAEGSEQRLFIDGDNSIYSRGGVMSELRDPFLRVCPCIEQRQ